MWVSTWLLTHDGAASAAPTPTPTIPAEVKMAKANVLVVIRLRMFGSSAVIVRGLMGRCGRHTAPYSFLACPRSFTTEQGTVCADQGYSGRSWESSRSPWRGGSDSGGDGDDDPRAPQCAEVPMVTSASSVPRSLLVNDTPRVQTVVATPC